MAVSRSGTRRVRRGFTLIELLVVIAIIGILIALCCRPCKRLASSQGLAVQQPLKQLGLAWHNHADVYGYLPGGGWAPSGWATPIVARASVSPVDGSM